MIAQIQQPANQSCNRCGGRSKKFGFARNGRQRYRCHDCGRCFQIHECSPFTGMRIPQSKCVNVMQCLTEGMGVRGSASCVGVDPATVIRLIRVTGFVRRCRTCDKPIPGGTSKYWFCSLGCQAWRQNKRRTPTTPLFDATANVLRTIASTHGHERLALEVAQEISELNAADYLGPCYEAIATACHRGIVDEQELRLLARDNAKRMWRETHSFARSLQQIRDGSGWEPHVITER